MLLTGANEQQSYNNIIEWLHQVATDFPLPCHAFPTGLRRQILKCCYHSLQDDELHKFVQHLQMKLMNWGATCVGLGLSGGGSYQDNPKGKGGHDICIHCHWSIFGLSVVLWDGPVPLDPLGLYSIISINTYRIQRHFWFYCISSMDTFLVLLYIEYGYTFLVLLYIEYGYIFDFIVYRIWIYIFGFIVY